MIKFIMYISILIILYYCVLRVQEHFQVELNNNKNCCVIRKQRLGAVFNYTYNPSQYCDYYHDNFLRTIKEDDSIAGVPFDMEDCEEPEEGEEKFGSCRLMGGFECVDFVTKEECDKYPVMKWNTVSCNNQIKYDNKYYKYSIKQEKLFAKV